MGGGRKLLIWTEIEYMSKLILFFKWLYFKILSCNRSNIKVVLIYLDILYAVLFWDRVLYNPDCLSLGSWQWPWTPWGSSVWELRIWASTLTFMLCAVVGIKPKTLYMLGKHSTNWARFPYSQPVHKYFLVWFGFCLIVWFLGGLFC